MAELVLQTLSKQPWFGLSSASPRSNKSRNKAPIIVTMFISCFLVSENNYGPIKKNTYIKYVNSGLIQECHLCGSHKVKQVFNPNASSRQMKTVFFCLLPAYLSAFISPSSSFPSHYDSQNPGSSCICFLKCLERGKCWTK